MKRTMRLEGATALLIASLSGGAVHAAMDPGGVIENYADIAHAMYEDSLNAAQELDARIGALLDTPGAETLSAAREAVVRSISFSSVAMRWPPPTKRSVRSAGCSKR